MEVQKAEILGFCFGVRRAVELAQNAIESNCNKKIYSLGPLIHNETVLNELEKKGLSIISEEDIENLDANCVVIIRAHGTNPFVLSKLKEKNVTVIDATCPRVKNSQSIVSMLSQKKDFIIFTGDKNHGEVKSIEGYGSNNFILVQNVQETEDLLKNNKNITSDSSVLLLSQTTYSAAEFTKISDILTSKTKNIEIKNTICPATKERQEALLSLCKDVDGVIVIGGRNSANTARLYQIAKDNCKNAVFIQNPDEIPEAYFKLHKVGITAGASTPDDIINKVVSLLHG